MRIKMLSDAFGFFPMLGGVVTDGEEFTTILSDQGLLNGLQSLDRAKKQDELNALPFGMHDL